jgi:hypothetical protein
MFQSRLLLLLLAAASASFGQALNGTVLGSISDSTGAFVQNAKITVFDLNTNFTRSVQSADSGNYTISNLPPGLYNVSVELTGFRKSIRDRVDVAINSTTRVDFQLQPGQINEQIEVTAELPALQTDRTDTGRSMDQRQVSELPLTQNRNFQGLVNLVPGAARAQRNHSEFFNSNDSMQSRVNGSPASPTMSSLKASTTTTAPACSPPTSRPPKPFRRSTSPPPTTRPKWAAPVAP